MHRNKDRGSAYREYTAELRRRDMIAAELSKVQAHHGRLVQEREALQAQLKAYQHQAEENGRFVGPNHPVVRRLEAIEPLISEAAKVLKPAEAEYKRLMKESDTRMSEMKARHEADAAAQAKAEAAAQAAYDAAMVEAE